MLSTVVITTVVKLHHCSLGCSSVITWNGIQTSPEVTHWRRARVTGSIWLVSFKMPRFKVQCEWLRVSVFSLKPLEEKPSACCAQGKVLCCNNIGPGVSFYWGETMTPEVVGYSISLFHSWFLCCQGKFCIGGEHV